MDWPAWISAIANLIVAATAVVTAILAYKQYLRAPEQEPEPTIARDEAAARTPEDVTVFQTSRQRTYLQVTASGLECHLDDVRPDRGGLQWTIAPREAAAIIDADRISVDAAHTARTGRFSVGPRRNWLYSKRLFPDPEYLRGALKELLRRSAAQG